MKQGGIINFGTSRVGSPMETGWPTVSQCNSAWPTGVRSRDGVIRRIADKPVVADKEVRRRLSSMALQPSLGLHGGVSLDLEARIRESGLQGSDGRTFRSSPLRASRWANPSFGGFPVEVFVRRIGIRFGGMDGAIQMFGRTIDGVKLERLRTPADDVVPGAGRNDDAVIRLHPVADAINPDFAFARFDTKKLVTILMGFDPNLVTRLYRHQDQLQVCSRVENAAEITVFLGQSLDIVYKALHSDVPSSQAVVTTLWYRNAATLATLTLSALQLKP